ncbi:MAG: DUF4868 domain-containing protein [Candidatus Methanoperedens sp.]|nr:DUF4868 domain-containing protein [Candidatus Methanoperedens sp.]
MTAEQKFQDLINIEEITGAVTLGLGSFPPDSEEPNYRSLNISDGLASEFRTIINRYNAAFRKDYGDNDLRLLEYDAGYKPYSHEIEWVEFPDVDYLSNLLNDIPDPADMPLFSQQENEFLKHLRFYVIIIQNERRDPIYCFCTYSKKKELSKGKKIIAVRIGDRYEALTQKGFVFDERIDCIASGNYVFSFNKNRFQLIFRFYDKLKEVATESLTSIQACIPIANFSDFSTSCMSHLQKLEKLRNIANKPYLAQITIEDIRRTIDRNRLNVEFVVENGQEKLKFDPKDKWAILNLLDDAYLESEMTHLNYEVSSKRQLNV